MWELRRDVAPESPREFAECCSRLELELEFSAAFGDGDSDDAVQVRAAPLVVAPGGVPGRSPVGEGEVNREVGIPTMALALAGVVLVALLLAGDVWEPEEVVIPPPARRGPGRPRGSSKKKPEGREGRGSASDDSSATGGAPPSAPPPPPPGEPTEVSEQPTTAEGGSDGGE